MAQQYTVDPTSPDQTRPITMGGVRYRIRLVWRRRLGWYMALYDAGGDLIVSGIRLRAGWPLFAGLAMPGLPAGTLLVSGPLRDIGRYDLGSIHQLRYYTADEIAAGAVDREAEASTPVIVWADA